MEKIKKAFRLLGILARLFRAEYGQFTQAVRHILACWRTRIVNYIVLRYNCREIRRKMLEVKSSKEWASLARLLDHLEGC